MAESLLQRAIRRHGAAALLSKLTPEQKLALRYNWRLLGRPEQQLPPGNWRVWLFLAGRGGGKTRSASEAVRYMVESGKARRIALVGETAADARDVMVEQGESSLLKTARPGFRPTYEPSKRRLTWPNGAVAITYSADDPEQLRGPEHDFAWCDELAKWRRPEGAWSNLQFGLRLNGPDGSPPRVVVTTTPRATPLVVSLAKGDRQLDGTYVPRPDVAVTTCSTYDNAANLAPSFIDEIRREYEGTRLGEQELLARILDDIDGALWTMQMIDAGRVREAPERLDTAVVAVDPPATSDGAEAGIIAAGKARGDFGIGEMRDHYFVLEDASTKGSPNKWATAAIRLYQRRQADCIVAESNNGGEMVKHTIHSVDPNVPVKLVHASRGKRTRAEPVAALYEQGLVHHVGSFLKLEDQQTTWIPGNDSPDRMDALVWSISRMMKAKRRRKPAPGAIYERTG